MGPKTPILMSACAVLAPAKISTTAANACNCQPGFRNLVIFTSMRTLIIRHGTLIGSLVQAFQCIILPVAPALELPPR